MNERIKDLVKQAGGHISMRNLASNPVQHIESVELWDDRIEKFAELIVKECADMVASSSLPDAYSEPCLREIADEIKEHFGVEQ
jgi:hypothetical protein